MEKKENIDARKKARKLLEVSLEKKPSDPIVLDFKNVGLIWDYCLIMTSHSEPQTNAIVEEVKKSSKKEGFLIHHAEDDEDKGWVLLDYGDVVVHIFSEEKRRLYRLESLLKRGKKVNFRFRKK